MILLDLDLNLLQSPLTILYFPYVKWKVTLIDHLILEPSLNGSHVNQRDLGLNLNFE